MNIQQNIDLKIFSSLQIGGPAKFFVQVETDDDLVSAVKWAKENNEPIFILAGASNVLINDQGVNGLVIKIANKKLETGDNKVVCGAGVPLYRLIGYFADNSLTGLAWGHGIPGTVGGAVCGNAGAFGKNMDPIVIGVRVFDTDTMEFKYLTNEECKFTYRHTRFREEKNLIIWEIDLVAQKGDQEEIKKEMDYCLQYRLRAHPKVLSVGCFFKNLTTEELEKNNPELLAEFNNSGIIKGGKIGCGVIIDRLGFKGHTVGGAQVSDKHANFLTNTGTASSADLCNLAKEIKDQAKAKFNLELEEEAQYFGF